MATRETMERVPFLLQQERLNNETRQLPKTIDNGVISIALGNCLDHCQWLGPTLPVTGGREYVEAPPQLQN